MKKRHTWVCLLNHNRTVTWLTHHIGQFIVCYIVYEWMLCKNVWHHITTSDSSGKLTNKDSWITVHCCDIQFLLPFIIKATVLNPFIIMLLLLFWPIFSFLGSVHVIELLFSDWLRNLDCRHGCHSCECANFTIVKVGSWNAITYTSKLSKLFKKKFTSVPKFDFSMTLNAFY